MATTRVATCYISCGCNRTPHSADWGHNGLLCYGTAASVSIATIDKPSAVHHTLTGHAERVNCVRWIRKQGQETESEFVSGSTDSSVRIWRKRSDKEFETCAVLKGHTSSVNAVAGIYVAEPGQPCDVTPRTLVATASADSTVRIWERKGNEETFECVHIISLGSSFAMDLVWAFLPGTCVPVLAYGGDDTRIDIVTEVNGKFQSVHKLVGHEDWIQALCFTANDNGDLLLASGAQDCFIRIWRLYSTTQQPKPVTPLQVDEDIKLKENTFFSDVNGAKLSYGVSLESVLLGHENWVYSVQWKPQERRGGQLHQSMCLLSASMDKTMILWEPEPETGVWIEKARMGDVGGNTLGFYGGVFAPDGATILGHGYQGAFHVWHHNESGEWEPGVPLGGHFASVQDLCWDPEEGSYLLTVSLDQTTRLHAFWTADPKEKASWHEVARPQLHGYDIQCVTAINRFQFASGADEKVIRVFEAPLKFLQNFAALTSTDLQKAIDEKRQSAPEGASVPALGLSNKAVFQADLAAQQDQEKSSNSYKDQYPEFYFTAVDMHKPPSEDMLLQNTLWPEVQKLYGHGYEIFALASHPAGSYLASACKAAKAEHANVIIWDMRTWKQACQLASHSLTVTQLAFSPSGRYLLSVSRDRTWSLFSHNGHIDSPFSRLAYSDKKTGVHSRIIWSCSWAHDEKYFVTASRDKKAVIWQLGTETANPCLGNVSAMQPALDLPQAITAVDFAPLKIDNCYILAFGLEDGSIHIYSWSPEKGDLCWSQQAIIEKNEAHHLAVKRLQFSPKVLSHQPITLHLASCSDDHAVKIYTIVIDHI